MPPFSKTTHSNGAHDSVTRRQRAWLNSPEFAAAGERGRNKARLARDQLPVCGAKCRSRDGTCRNYPLANGRCKLHGGMVPKGDQWHVVQFDPNASPEKIARKKKEIERRRERQRQRVAAMTPERQEAYYAWHRRNKPGPAVHRARARQDQEAKAMFDRWRVEREAEQMRAAKGLAAKLQKLVARIEHSAAAEAARNGEGVFG